MGNDQRNEGEGNRTADRQYVEATKRFIQSGKVEPAAKDAERSIESPEGEALKRAEDEGRRRAKGEH